MALQDILAAITAEADKRIADARKAQQNRLTDIREKSEQHIAKRKQEIAMQKQEKQDQMLMKAQAHAQITKRNAELSKKQELLDAVYGDVVDHLCSLSGAELETFLKACLEQIQGSGTIRPSATHADLLKKLAGNFTIGEPVEAKGGFVFVSEKQERDYTFEHLVHAYLRPATEVETANSLFA